MSVTTEFSRLLFKRSTVPGVTPTVPTASTIDNTWATTDLMVGEIFLNTADDRLWMRTDNGIVEIAVSGTSFYRYTTGATLVDNTIFFDWTDTPSAYTLDLSSLVITGASGVWQTGVTGSYSIQATNPYAYATADYAIAGGTSSATTISAVAFGDINTASGNGAFAMGSSNTASGLYTAAIGAQNTAQGNYAMAFGKDNVVNGIGGFAANSDNFITGNYSFTLGFANQVTGDYAGVFGDTSKAAANSVFVLGSGITGSTANTTYVDKFNIKTIGAGASIINLGLDSNGNVVTGSTASIIGSNYLPITGGTLTGPLVINSTLNVTGNTFVKDFSASTISILNSGATLQAYTDYSSNLIQSGVTNSTIAAGSGNTIPTGLRNVFIAGSNITANANDYAYFSNLNVNTTLSASTLSASTIYASGINVNWCDLSFAISDETTSITTGTTKLTLYAPYAFTITKVIATLSTSGSSLSEFDVNVNGTTIFSRRPTIDANEFHSDDAAAGVPIVSSASVAYKDKITIDIDQAGTGAKGAKIYILGTRV